MALTKRTYTDFDEDTPITAQNLNDIQDEIISGANLAKALIVTASNVSSLDHTIENVNITDDMIVVGLILSNTRAQVGTWSVTAYNKSLRISGSISGSTNITLYLMKSR